MRVSLTLKLCVGVFVILTTALTVILWKTTDIIRTDKIATTSESSSQLTYGLAQSTLEKIKRLDRQLANAVNSPHKEMTDEFMFKGFLKRKEGEPWQMIWLTLPNVYDQQLAEFATSIQKKLVLDEVTDKEKKIAALATLDHQSIFILLARLSRGEDGSERIGVGIFDPVAFVDLISVYKGAQTSAFIVDRTGLVLAHPSMNVTGTTITEHPVVADLINSQMTSSVGQYEQANGEKIIGSFEKVQGTNLFAVTSIPTSFVFSSLGNLRWSFLVLGFGLMLVALALTFYSAQVLKSPLLKLRKAIEDLATGGHIHVDWSGDDEIGDLADSLVYLDKKLEIRAAEFANTAKETVHKEKNTAFNQLSAGLVSELRNPLIGILGHTQLAREKIEDPQNLRRHLDLIEKDCRKTKDLIEDIARFSGTEKLELTRLNIYEIVSASIEQAEKKLIDSQVVLVKNITPAGSVVANASLLRKAVMNLVTGAASFIEKTSKKELFIRLEAEGKFCKVTLSFEVGNISDFDLERIFDPFINIGEISLGLDMALAKGIFKAHDGRVTAKRIGETRIELTAGLSRLEESEAHVPTAPTTISMSAISFSLPDFIVVEKPEERIPTVQVASAESNLEKTLVIQKEFISKIPLESLRVKVRKPRLRV